MRLPTERSSNNNNANNNNDNKNRVAKVLKFFLLFVVLAIALVVLVMFLPSNGRKNNRTEGQHQQRQEGNDAATSNSDNIFNDSSDSNNDNNSTDTGYEEEEEQENLQNTTSSNNDEGPSIFAGIGDLDSTTEDDCSALPETFDDALRIEEMKKWPDAAKDQYPLDISGIFQFQVEGVPPSIVCYTRIFQECLELTIVSGCINEITGALIRGSPLHHYIMDNTYVHVDQINGAFCGTNQVNGNCFYSLGPTVNKALVTSATREWCEKYGVRHVSMLVGRDYLGGSEGTTWNAVRGIDTEGSLVFTQNANALQQYASDLQVQKRSSSESVECNGNNGWDPNSQYCRDRSYLDYPWSYTPACCTGYDNLDIFTELVDTNLYPNITVQPFPDGLNVVPCDGSAPTRMV